MWTWPKYKYIDKGERVCSNCTHGTSTFNVILNYALKHTFQLRGMASTLCMCTTVSPRQWQSWPLLGLKKDGRAVGLMSGRNGVSNWPFTPVARAKQTGLSASSTVDKWWLLVGKRKTILPWHAYGDEIRKRDWTIRTVQKEFSKHRYKATGLTTGKHMRNFGFATQIPSTPVQAVVKFPA